VQNHGCQSMWDKFEFGLFDSISRIYYSVIASLHLQLLEVVCIHAWIYLCKLWKLCTGTHACRHILNYYTTAAKSRELVLSQYHDCPIDDDEWLGTLYLLRPG